VRVRTAAAGRRRPTRKRSDRLRRRRLRGAGRSASRVRVCGGGGLTDCLRCCASEHSSRPSASYQLRRSCEAPSACVSDTCCPSNQKITLRLPSKGLRLVPALDSTSIQVQRIGSAPVTKDLPVQGFGADCAWHSRRYSSRSFGALSGLSSLRPMLPRPLPLLTIY
jgi:hypothetical protein